MPAYHSWISIRLVNQWWSVLWVQMPLEDLYKNDRNVRFVLFTKTSIDPFKWYEQFIHPVKTLHKNLTQKWLVSLTYILHLTPKVLPKACLNPCPRYVQTLSWTIGWTLPQPLPKPCLNPYENPAQSFLTWTLPKHLADFLLKPCLNRTFHAGILLVSSPLSIANSIFPPFISKVSKGPPASLDWHPKSLNKLNLIERANITLYTKWAICKGFNILS